MSAIAKTQIPNAINTMEKLAAYSALALARVNPTLNVFEGEIPNKASEVTVIKANDGRFRLVARISIEVDPTWVSDSTNPLYNLVLELSNAQIPSGFIQA